MTWNGPPRRVGAVPGDGSQAALVEEAIGTLETAVEDEALFLWTGGKDAQVIADLLLYAVGGDDERSPLPFGVIDTGNHFEAMYGFREEYAAATGDRGADTVGPFTGVEEVLVERHDELLEHVIRNDDDPRGYHGRHDGAWTCPDCGHLATVEEESSTGDGAIVCPDCGAETELHPVQKRHLTPEEWGVPESCGALKVVPIRRFVDEHGFDTLVTGRRGDDAVVQTDARDGVDLVEEVADPVPHTRVNPLANWREANVYAYLKAESVSLPSLYTDAGYRHTDAECCTTAGDRGTGEYGEGGVDPEKVAARDRLQDMGYI